MKITFALEYITPEIAKRYLEKNKANRHVDEFMVAKYARDIADNRWRSGTSDIVFLDDESLGDGQHRLLAIIKSGVGVLMGVKRGVPVESKIAFDSGKNRTFRDSVKLSEGVDKIHGIASSKIKQIISSVLTIERGGVASRSLSNGEICDFADRFADGLLFISPFCVSNKKGVNSPVWAAFLGCFYHVDASQLDLFLRLFSGNADPREPHEVNPIRLKLSIVSGTATRRDAALIYERTQRAVQAFINKEPLKMFRACGVIYPATENLRTKEPTK